MMEQVRFYVVCGRGRRRRAVPPFCEVRFVMVAFFPGANSLGGGDEFMYVLYCGYGWPDETWYPRTPKVMWWTVAFLS